MEKTMEILLFDFDEDDMVLILVKFESDRSSNSESVKNDKYASTG